MLVNLEALGILLRIFTVDLERGEAGRTATGAGEEETTAGSIGAGDDGWVDVRLTGGRRDPGQRAHTEPCCLINPATVTATERKQTEQDELGFEITLKFAPMDRAAILFDCHLIGQKG